MKPFGLRSAGGLSGGFGWFLQPHISLLEDNVGEKQECLQLGVVLCCPVRSGALSLMSGSP